MKILIAGPLPTSKVSGGVAVFTKNLAKEAADEGYKVLVATDTKRKKSNEDLLLNNIKLCSYCNVYRIKKFNPDIIISSLYYSFVLSFFNLKGKKIHILHGFTTLKHYSLQKFFIMHLIDKSILKKYDFILANSKFTKFINEEIFGNRVNGVFTIGLDSNELLKCQKSNGPKSGVLYVGRLVKAKGVDKALLAFLKLNRENSFNSNFTVAGYGNEYETLVHRFGDNKNIQFLGSIDHSKIQELYRKSKVFISLNPSEPFGITYEEAIANGLFVIAPDTGGQVDFLTRYPGRYALVNVDNIDSICEGIKKGLMSNLSNVSKEELNNMSYIKTLKEIIN
jgi:glycosyltransferase involved in cell wall biosynthesis